MTMLWGLAAYMVWAVLAGWVSACLLVANEIARGMRAGEIGPFVVGRAAHGRGVFIQWITKYSARAMYSDSARTSHDRALFLLRSSLIRASWTATRHALAAIEQNAAGGQRRQSAVSADKGVSSETSSSSSEHGSFSCKQVSHYPYLHLNHTCIFKSLEMA
ncbi:hypothetical protein VPH35_040882 [Triticum aestivum]